MLTFSEAIIARGINLKRELKSMRAQDAYRYNNRTNFIRHFPDPKITDTETYVSTFCRLNRLKTK